MTTDTSMPRLACSGCATIVDAIGPGGPTWRCPRAGEGDVDHVLRPIVAWGDTSWEADASSRNPFIRYRRRLTSYHAARALGLSDAAFVDTVERLDAQVAEVDGAGFHVTPLRYETALALNVDTPCGNLLSKVEADHVSGSHKARHLMGIMLMLEAWRAATGSTTDARLAIASCGNAALAAAVVAKAAGRSLDVFVPTWASGAVVDRLRSLGATINTCARMPGVAGDPCYHGFKDAVAHGAIPFCCQGSDNGLTIEGAETIAWELLDASDGLAPDAVFVQVGGGALATAILRGVADDHRFGHTSGTPRFHAVQTLGCAPLVRAYDRVVERLLRSAGTPVDAFDTLAPSSVATRADRARAVAASVAPDALDSTLQHAAAHRSQFMWPWEAEPKSLATGILDDETYDWLAIVEGMLRTGGHPVFASEDTLATANRIVRDATGIDACVTGSSGLAGLMDALPADARLRHERVAVIISGHRR